MFVRAIIFFTSMLIGCSPLLYGMAAPTTNAACLRNTALMLEIIDTSGDVDAMLAAIHSSRITPNRAPSPEQVYGQRQPRISEQEALELLGNPDPDSPRQRYHQAQSNRRRSEQQHNYKLGDLHPEIASLSPGKTGNVGMSVIIFYYYHASRLLSS